MKKFLVTLLVLSILFISSCSEKTDSIPEKKERLFFNKYAYFLSNDGWSYCFKYQYFTDGREGRELVPYAFNSINFRYAYSRQIMDDPDAAQPILKMQVMGDEGCDPALLRDMRKIAALLCYNMDEKPSVDELLATDRNSLSFEVLDGDIFFDLMTQALTEPQREYSDKYVEFPSYAMLAEPAFTDGYKFQIGFRTGNGYVDVLYIDVLYQTGERFNQYVQLSDIIEKGDPTDGQRQLWELVRKITGDVLENNDFTYGMKDYKNTVVDNVNMKRLADFISDISRQSYNKYM